MGLTQGTQDYLLDRANHTGTQLAATISDFAAAVAASGAGGITDGDKGDITVLSGVWTIDPNAVTLAKIAQMPTASFLGRSTAGTGNVENLTVLQVRTLLGYNLNALEDVQLDTVTNNDVLKYNSTLGEWKNYQLGTLAAQNASAVAITGGTVNSANVNDTVLDGCFINAANNYLSNVQPAQLASVPTATFLGRNTAGTGNLEVLSAATVKSLLSLNLVDNTSDAAKNSATVTLTNKTLIAPVISTIANTGTLTLPTTTGTLALASQITDAGLSTSDITTNNVSATKHGFAPKLPADAAKFLNGAGAWTVPASGSGGARASHTLARFKISQDGSAFRPNALVFFENTLGVTYSSWTYNDVGSYRLTFSGNVFADPAKVACPQSKQVFKNDAGVWLSMDFVYVSATECDLVFLDAVGTAQELNTTDFFLEILVYP